MTIIRKSVEDYLSLPYTVELIPESGGGWFVAVKELPGCMSEGETPDDALRMIRDAMRGWIEAALADGDPIPEPRTTNGYSGKFVVRVPRSLHRQLAELADEQSASLNQLVNVALAHYVAHEMGGRDGNCVVRRKEALHPPSPAVTWEAASAVPAVGTVGEDQPQWNAPVTERRPRRKSGR